MPELRKRGSNRNRQQAMVRVAVLPLIIFVTSVLATIPSATPIIIRHDVSDEDYVALADSLDLSAAVVRFTRTDMAGTLIAQDWILSAAHVAQEVSPGGSLLWGSGDSLRVERVVLHPLWLEEGFPHDIALIKLTTPVEGAVTIPLYLDSDEEGRLVTLIGNGDLGDGTTGPTGNDGRFRAATNRIDNLSDSWLAWRFDGPNDPGTTPMEGISGPGDSAGPAFIQRDGRYFVAGVSSGQDTQATGGREGRYGVTEYYTRVSAYSDWIASVVASF